MIISRQNGRHLYCRNIDVCAVANVMRLTVHPAQRVPSTLDVLEIGSQLSQMKRTGSYIRLCWVWRRLLNCSKATRTVAKRPALLMQTYCRLLHGHKQISWCRGVSKLILLLTRKWNRLDSKVISLRFVGLLYFVGTYGSLPCAFITLMYTHLLLVKMAQLQCQLYWKVLVSESVLE